MGSLVYLCTRGAYYVPYSCILISNKFCNGGERSKQGEQVPLCTAPAPLSVWARNLPCRLLCIKTTYAPIIYTALCKMFWMSAYRVFWAPNGTHLLAQCHFTGPKKLLNSMTLPPPTCPRNGYAASKTLCTGCIIGYNEFDFF
jgi:hypothetical protein